jgi:hypothetical protein
MRKVKINKETRDDLLKLKRTRKIYLEGNIIKLIDSDGDEDLEKYLVEAIEKDKEARRKRLEITKDIQKKNKELTDLNKENERVNKQLKKALIEAETSRNQAINSKEEAENSRMEAENSRVEAENARIEAEKARVEAENAKITAENNLEIEQRKTQVELMGTIVRVALWIIGCVGVVTTSMYGLALWKDADTEVIGSTWTNIISILLTNAFSIVGTIMGVKYATSDREKKD